MGHIASPGNPKIKLARALARRRARSETRQFLAEGTRLIAEGLRAGFIPALVLYDEAALSEEGRTLRDAIRTRTSEVHSVEPPLLTSLAQTDTPQGLIAVFDLPQLPLPLVPRLVLVLDQLRDPGNVGTILRSAWAAGVEEVWLAPGTVDPFNAKAVRAGMGAHFFLPLRAAGWDELAGRLQSVPRIYLADARGEIEYTRADWSPPLALTIGGEADGASETARRLATGRVSIPLRGGAESLNAAMAATVLIFEATRSSPHDR